jgi:ATP-binding cassette subfamily C (CFTR/MRP) protein 10
LLELNSFDNFQLAVLFVINFLLLVYFVILIAGSFKPLSRNLSYQQLISDHESEEDKANYLSYLTFEWLQPIMVKGYQKQIEIIDHLSQLPNDMNVSKVSDYFMKKFSVNKQNQNNPIINPELLLNQNTYQELLDDTITINSSTKSLALALMRSFGPKFFILGVYKLLNDIINFAGPMLLNQLVKFVETKDAKLKDGCMFAAALLLSTLVGSIINIHFTNSLNKLCLKIKTALITLIYRKAVLVRMEELNKLSTGQIVNYMSIDADAVVNAFPSFHSFWSLPFQIVITLYLLYSQIGISFVILFFILLNFLFLSINVFIFF